MRALFHHSIWAAAAGFCAVLLMCSGRTASAQAQTGSCTTIGAMLGGSGTFKGVNAYAQTDARDLRDMQGSRAALQTYLAAAHKDLAAALAIGDTSLAAYERTIIARLDSGVESNKRLLASSTATLDLTQQQQRTLRQEAAVRRCTNLGYQAQPQPVTGSGATTTGAIDLAGSWVMHLHGAMDSPVEYYDYDAVLTGPPGGPWRIVTTMRHNTSQLPNAEPVGRVDSQCTMWTTGPTSIERRCPIPAAFRPAGGPAESVQQGSIVGDHLTLFKMTGLPLMPYGEMRRGAYQQAARQPAISPGTWKWSATCGGSPYSGTFTVALQPDNTFYGQFTQDGASAVYNGTIAGRLQAASIVFNRRWGSPGEQQWSGRLDQSGLR
jgi:hypothetical protein